MNTANMGRRKVSPLNNYSHTFVFRDDYPLPDVNLIKMQVRYSGVILAGITPAISVDGARVTVTYTTEMLGKMPLLVQHYLLLNGAYFIEGEIELDVNRAHQETSETHVTVTDGDVTVVEVMGMNLVTAQVAIATEKAAEATQGAATATTQAGIATSGANTATTKAGEAAGSAAAAGISAASAEADRIQTGLDKDAVHTDALQVAADKTQTGLDRIATAADRAQTGADKVQTGLDVVAANSARDASLIQAGVYVDEPTGRASVADGQAFKVQGTGDVAAYEYRRVNSGSSTLIATYPSKAAVDSHGVTFTDDVEPPSNNFLNPAFLQSSVFVNNTGGLSATTSSFSVFTGTWGSNTSFVAGGNGVQFSMFSIAQYNSSGTFISGTYQGTDNVMNPTKHASAVTFKVTLRVGNINQLNWGASILPHDAFFEGATHKVGNKNVFGDDAVFEANLRSAALLALLPTIPNTNKSVRQQAGIDGYRNVITVKKDGTGNFTNLVAAIVSITDASPMNKYLVQVYDNHTGLVKTDFTNFPTHQTYYEMLIGKDNVKVVGMGELKLIHSEIPSNSTKTEFEVYETCHLEGSSEIENLYLRANRNRYALHIDHGNTSFNQNCLIKLTGCVFEHLGVADVPGANQWSAPDAVGIGTAAGFHLEAVRCKFIGTRYAFRAHTTYSSALPDHFVFDACSFITKTADGAAINLDNLGCQQKRFVEMRNCSIYGSFVVPSALDAANTSIPKALPGIQVRGGGNSPFLWINNQNIGQVLRIVSATTGTTSFVKVVQDDAGLFGNTTEKPGSLGLSGQIYGDNELISAGTDKRYIIGHRLGNCTTVNKLLVLNIDGTNRTVTFNQNYSNGTYTANPTIDATTILAAINSALSGFAVASYYQVNLDYYPELDDVLFYKGNTSNTTFIPKGSAVKNVGLNRCRIAVADEVPDGFALEDIPVSSTIMQMGRVLKNAIVLKTDRYCPLFETGADTFVEGTCFKISANGKLQIDATAKDSFAKALDSTRILLK